MRIVSQRLRVVSWNVLHAREYPDGGVDLERCADAIAALDADVVALQEVDRHLERSDDVDQVKELAARTGMHGVFAPSLFGSPGGRWEPAEGADHGGSGYGIGLLSRWPVLGHTVQHLPGGNRPRPGRRATSSRPWDSEPRIALSSVLDVDGRRLRVTNVHLSFLPWRGIAQVLVAARAARGGGPAVLLGDFNLPRWAVRAAAMEFRHTGGAATFPADAPHVQLDHILVRGAIKPLETRVGPRLTSDHLPLSADLLLR